MFKLIAVDMDGTLLRGDSSISKRSKEYFKSYIEKGGILVISTGRPIQGVKSYLQELDLLGKKGFVINNNGATIYSTENLERVRFEGLTVLDGREIVELAKNLNLKVHGFQNHRCIAVEENKYTKLEEEHIKIRVDIIDFNKLSENEEIIKMMVLEEEEILDKGIKKISKEFYNRFNIVRSTPYMLEFMKKGIHKGTALEYLCEKLSIKREEVVAFGDGDNDKEMFNFAKTSVAMGNSKDHVKTWTTHTTKTNEEDGIVEFLESFI